MKETLFRINIKVNIAEQPRVHNKLTAAIQDLPGVIRVDLPFDLKSETVEMSVSVRFDNTSEAQRLHKKVMRLISQYEGVCITGIAYDLNAMFGEN